MNMHLIWGIIVVFGSYFTRADVQQLQVNERAYLPPDNKEYLPPSQIEVKEVVNSMCNLPPMIIYNAPPPVKVKSKLNNEYLPPAKDEGKVLGKVVPISPELQQKLQDPKPKKTKILDHNNLTMNREYLPPSNDDKHTKGIAQDYQHNQPKIIDHNNVTIKPKQPMNREYLPPSNDDKHTETIDQGYQHNQPKAIPDPLPIGRQQLTKKTINGSSYQHNQPKAIDDPLPIRVNYIQPLRLDFLDGQLKPITKGPLFTGLFLNASEIKLSTERLPKRIRFNQTKTTEVKQNMKPLPLTVNSTKQDMKPRPLTADSRIANTNGKEAISPTKQVNYELKPENSLQNTKYHKKFEDDIVLINYPDATTNFKLFNSDDDSLLSGSAPEVIFKPGDDISFVHDTSIIDDYEHIPAKAKKIETSLTTKKTTTSTTPIPLPLKAYTTQDKDQDAQAAHEEAQSNETERSVTNHGYSYEKPKYESIQEQTTEALSRQADECANTEIRDNKPQNNEQPIAQDDSVQAEHQSNESDHGDAGAGYFYEKPKIPFDF